MQNGEREELDRLIRERMPDLLGFLIRMTGCLHLAEDLAQETLLRALRHRDKFRGEASFKTWLYSIAVNVFRDVHKSPKHKRAGLSTEPVTERDEPSDNSMHKELKQQIAQHISSLPPRQREVLILMTYEGLDANRVSEILNVKPSNVYANLHHARETLKHKLKDYLKD